MLELEPVARPRAVGPQGTAVRLGDAVEEHPLDPDMIVEVLEISEVEDTAGEVTPRARSAPKSLIGMRWLILLLAADP